MQARLIESHEIAPEVRHFVFEAEGIERLEYAPGQFVSLSAERDGKTITRAYSLASAPRGDNRFELCLNRVEQGRLHRPCSPCSRAIPSRCASPWACL